jgi:hypothetical protein
MNMVKFSLLSFDVLKINIMKKIALFAVALVAATFTSCDTKDLLDIALDGQLKKTLNVATTIESDSTSFTDDFTVSLADNEEFAKYGDKVKSISISKISVEVDKVNVGEATTAIESLLIVYIGTSTIEVNVSKVLVKDAEENDTVVAEYSLTGEQAAAFGEQLLSAGNVSFIVTGSLYNAPADVDLGVIIEASLVATPL